MKVYYDGQNIKLDIYELVDNLPDDAKLDFIESMACQETVIEHVASQLLSGWTERGFHGSKNIDSVPHPSTALDRAAREIAKRSTEIAKKEIEKLEESLKNAIDRREEYEKKYWDLYHAKYG